MSERPATDEARLALYLREVSADWAMLNRERFRARLKPPVFEVFEGDGLLGQYDSKTRTLRLSRELLLRAPWGDIVEVLKHEMAHQYVLEALGVRDETAHGRTFRAVCRDLGIDPSAASPLGQQSEEDARLSARIEKLLALAQSANVHEAEAAMVAAQRLLARHRFGQKSTSVDGLNAPGAPQPRAHYTYRQLGEPQGRIYEPDRVLAGLLAAHFFVEAIWVSALRKSDGLRGSVLEVCGTRAHVDLAEYVHGFLKHTSERLYEEHARARGGRSRADRRAYLAGVMAGFRRKLEQEQQRLSAEEGLVWVQDGDLTDYYRHRHPRIRQVRYLSERGGQAFRQGEAAGARIILRRAFAEGPSQGGAPPLLPPRR
jgi:hypothetical protein